MFQFLPVKKEKCHSDSLWNNLIRMSFENVEVSISADYDVVLKGTYGDYMQLPPIVQRVSPHQLKAWLIK